MKRCLAFVLSALLILASIPAVSAVGDYNDDQFHWGEGVCSHTNVTEKAAVASTCYSRGHGAYTVCNDCGAVVAGSKTPLPFAEHTYDHACDADCNACGITREVGDHIYDNACDTACNACGDIREVEPHTYESGVLLAPTCGADGTMQHTCSTCGDTYTTVIAATGAHTYDNACDTDCNVCGGTREVEPHTYESGVLLAPTCGAEGTMQHICSTCVDTYTTVIAATGAHTYDNACDADCNVCGGKRPPAAHTYDNACDANCNVCGAERIVGGHLTDATAACQDGFCQHCGAAVPATTTCQRLESAPCKDTVCKFCTNPMPATAEHAYDNACDADCNVCGGKRTPAAHTYDNACDVNCNVCGDVREVGDHAYSDAVTVPPSCENAGVRTYVCDHCGHTYTEAVSALGHDYKAAVTDPDCENKGYTTHTCAVCGHSYIDSEVAALGHDYDVAVTDPDCENEGYTTHTCLVCGHSYVDGAVAALGHDYKAAVTAPDCENEGYTTHTCANCGHAYVDGTVAALGHDYKAVVTDPDCENKGYTTHTCQNCGHSYVDGETDALGHTTVTDAYKAPTCTETGLTEGKHCGVCGEVFVAQQDIPANGHSHKTVVTAPTCESEGYTTYTCHCGDTYKADYVDALGHDYDVVVTAPDCENEGYTTHTCANCGHSYVDSTVAALGHAYDAVVTAPDCENKGYTTHTCQNCGDTYVDGEVAALGHTTVTDAYKAPTCTETGLTEGKHCGVCGEVFIAQQEIPANGHSHKTVVTAPTCEEKGYTTYTCHCGDTYKADYVDALGHDYDVVVTAPTCEGKGYTTHTCWVCGHSYVDSEIAAPGHSAVEDAYKAPTCTETGLTAGEHCGACDQVIVVQQEIPAKGHDYAGQDADCTSAKTCVVCGFQLEAALGHAYDAVVTAPTCEDKGYTTHTCSRCYDSYKDDYVDAPGHAYDAVVTAPTCEDQGYTTHTCAVCGHSYVDGEMAALGHAYDAVVTAPDCENKGYTTHICDNCGDTYTDSETDALGHTPVTDSYKAPTCTETGLNEGKHCGVCGDIIVAQTAIPATGHNHKTVVTAPTCEADGYTTYTCHCDDTYKADYVDALGHDYQAVVTAPDCEDQGYTTHTCSRCYDSYKNDYVDASGHAYDAVVTDPDCENEGYTTHTCATCGDTYTDSVVDALGHDYKAVVTAPDCENKGYITHTCATCGDTYTDSEVAALGHTTVTDAYEAPTCTETGLNEGKHCGVCGEIIVAQTVIPATGHNHKTVVTAPTCEAGGYTTYTCHCGDTYKGNETAALGHIFNNEYDAACGRCDYTRGDANGDNKTNNRDLGLLQQYLNGWDVVLDTDAADVYADGCINNRDLAMLQRLLNW